MGSFLLLSDLLGCRSDVDESLHVDMRERGELDIELGAVDAVDALEAVEAEDMMLPFDERREDAREEVECDLLGGDTGD